MQTKIYLVRHAHANYAANERERPLSQKGLLERMSVTNYLANKQIDSLISSPYKRAIQTVEEIAKIKGLPVITDERYRERLAANRYIDNFQAAIKKLWDNPEYAYPGGESNIEAKRRVLEALTEHLQHYKNKTIIISTHGNILTLMLSHFDSNYGYEHWKHMPMPALYELTEREDKITIVPQTLHHSQQPYLATRCENGGHSE